MGYSVTIKYHPGNESSFGFDSESIKDKTFKIGKRDENITQEKLALSLMKELARRDIFVVDLEVVEYVKKEIKIKQSKDGSGILIGNKKYSYKNLINDDSIKMEIVENTSVSIPPAPPINNISPPPPISKNTVIRREYFSPDAQYSATLQGEYDRIGLTPNRPYNILEEENDHMGTLTYYKVINNRNEKIRVPISQFSAVDPQRGERMNNQFKQESDSNDIRLTHSNENNMGMPSIR